MRKTITVIITCICLLFFCASPMGMPTKEVPETDTDVPKKQYDIPMDTYEVESLLTNEDVALIALVTMAEAEGEPEQGKRLVIDTILNRMDSDHFPDTVYEVIYQPNQFSVMWNGRIERCEVRNDIYKLVMEELDTRTNKDVIFFNADRYSKYGTPMFQVGNHYFSSYE